MGALLGSRKQEWWSPGRRATPRNGPELLVGRLDVIQAETIRIADAMEWSTGSGPGSAVRSYVDEAFYEAFDSAVRTLGYSSSEDWAQRTPARLALESVRPDAREARRDRVTATISAIQGHSAQSSSSLGARSKAPPAVSQWSGPVPAWSGPPAAVAQIGDGGASPATPAAPIRGVYLRGTAKGGGRGDGVEVAGKGARARVGTGESATAPRGTTKGNTHADAHMGGKHGGRHHAPGLPHARTGNSRKGKGGRS